jgi:hypothetical protein
MIASRIKRSITMKRVIIVTYVVSVLLIASLTKASETTVGPVTKVQFDQEQQLVFVEGYRSNPCQKVPRPQVVRVDRAGRKILMKVIAPSAGQQICAQVVEGRYEIVFGVANLKLPANVPYQLTFENAVEGVEPVGVVSNGMTEGFPFKSLDLSGILIPEQNGFSIQTRTQNFKIAPSQLNLEAHSGRIVDISGHKISFGLPVESEITKVNETGELPNSLILTGISSSHP